MASASQDPQPRERPRAQPGVQPRVQPAEQPRGQPGERPRGQSVEQPGVRPVPIRGDTIRLGQLLKLAGVVDSGADVKALLADPSEPVRVNGQPETRRGRQLRDGDLVHAREHQLRVVAARPLS